MKQFILFILALQLSQAMQAQYNIDSLQNLLQREEVDSNRVKLLRLMAQVYQVYKPDSALLLSHEALTLSRKIKYVEGESRSLSAMANAYNRIGNYPKAMQLNIEKLKIEERRNDPENLAIVYMNIATVYLLQQEYQKALQYAFTSDSILVANEKTLPRNRYKDLRWNSLLNIGDMFEKNKQLDSAMEYTNRAYALAAKANDVSKIGPTLNNLGNICLMNGSTDLAILNYRRGLPFLHSVKDEECICETTFGLAKAFKKMGLEDSSMYYARQSFTLSKADGFLSKNLDVSSFLHDHFKAKNNIDSAYKYQSQMVVMKDSIQSAARIKEAQIISIDEQLRQKELREMREREKQELNKRLQFLCIGIMIPLIILLTIYFKGTKVKPSIVETLGVVSLLLFFECISLLLHPAIVEVTNHVPVLELIVFAIIATIITRSHHRIERWMLKHLTHRKDRRAEMV